MNGISVTQPIGSLGHSSLNAVASLGRFGVFLGQAVVWIFIPPFKWRQLLQRIHFIGVRSLSIILLTGAFTGMVLALQTFLTLARFGSEALLGPAVALELIR